MAALRLLDSGLAYRNPKPNIFSRHAFFPSVMERGNGELVVTFDLGAAMEAHDVRSYLCRSTDGGAIWSEPSPIPASPPWERPFTTTCRTTRARDGSLLGLVTFFDRSRAEEGLANPATDGFVRTEFALIRSTDLGRTWKAPIPIRPPLEWAAFESCAPITDLGGGRLLLPTAIWRDWEGNCPFGMKAVAFISEDSGRSWPRWATVMDGSLEGIAHFEQKQAMLADGRLLALCWAFDTRTGQSLRNRYTFSSDSGETFGPPFESPIQGETCTPLALADNRILCVYRRTDCLGLWAHLARLDGTAWIPVADEPIWGTSSAAYGKRSENTFEQLATLRFGYPSLVRESENLVFGAFWCYEDCVSSIRWFRLRV